MAGDNTRALVAANSGLLAATRLPVPSTNKRITPPFYNYGARLTLPHKDISFTPPKWCHTTEIWVNPIEVVFPIMLAF